MDKQKKLIKKNDELILVMNRTDICSSELWTGYKKSNFKNELEIIKDKAIFMERSLAENDNFYKQIIPYLIFKNNHKYFIMQRRKTTTEQRLALKYTLGIGGHLRKEDLEGSSIFDWALREFYEEVNYKGKINAIPLGIINDDATDVGKVHIGFAFLLEGDSSDISIKSELKSGILASKEEIKSLYYNNLETWSQIAYQLLCDM